MRFLERIVANKREEIERKKRVVSISAFHAMPLFARTPLSLAGALRGKDLAIIAEIKKASPSKGIIRGDADPLRIALAYVDSGASAVSVLTDEKFFLGKLDFLADIRPRVPVPILRKDFVFDSYQLHESKAFGADAILLIAAALDPGRLLDLHAEANSLGMQAIVEVHTEGELDGLDMSSIEIIGINNRDLSSFEIDLNTSIRLRTHIAQETIVVSESGISTSEDIDNLTSHGIHAVLIGESLMRSEDPGGALASLLRTRGACRGEG